MSESTTIRYERGDDGIVVLTIDDPGQSANTMNAAYIESMGATLDRLQAEGDEVKGVILTSAKKTFFAGGDLNDLIEAGPEDAASIERLGDVIKGQLRRLETLGVPVVSCINGAALGGGLEICLATHHRIAVEGRKVQLGFPEVQLGLLPGGGGVVRTVRMFGIADALLKWLMEGKRYRAAQALEMGMVDELVATDDELVPAARKWIGENPEAKQPWDQPGYKIPGGTPSNPKLAANLPAFPSNLRKQIKGANFPAPKHILSAAVEGAQTDIDNAMKIEGRYFTDLVCGQVSKNMIQAFFFDLQTVNGDRGRPEGLQTWRAEKAVVLGAGMMGAAIAYVCAKAGIEVVLKDVDQAAADRGKGYSEKLVAKGVERGKTTQQKGDALLARITPSTDPAAAAGADIVIEAVFEDPAVKEQVFEEIEPHLAPDAVLGSNTSTLPITELAQNVSRPADFIGLHFFSPVDKMPLLEIIKGEETSEEVLHKSLDFAKQISKTPIIVNDSRGFFTSRVISTFLNEGMGMVAEGIPAQSIEQASMQDGYPAPVLQLADELNLKLMKKIRVAAENAGEVAADWADHASIGVVDGMLEAERPGRLEGVGFYEYGDDGKRTGLWSGLKERWGGNNHDVPFEDLKERMLFIEALETVRCIDEGVIETAPDANIGSIMGIGFPAWTGGVVQYMEGYEGGLHGFVDRARELAERYGPRFEPPESLVDKADSGGSFKQPAAVAA